MSLYFILTVLNECSDRYNDINDPYTKLCENNCRCCEKHEYQSI